MTAASIYSETVPEISERLLSVACRRLASRSALVTGAARGIGFATAIRLAVEGAQVWIADRDAEALERACTAAGDRGITLHHAVMDSSDAGSIRSGVAAILDKVGCLDILVNNAGGSLHTPFPLLEEDEQDWERVMTLNVMSVVWTSQAVLPSMMQRRYGRIVNFGSKAGRFSSLIAGANYAASKGAVAALTRQMAAEFGPSGITVNCVCPGVVMTERTRRLWAERRTEEERAKVLADIPLRRYCSVEDVAAAVSFLASDDASFITGVALDLNGGQAMA
ncbi:SDR family NAD(P)-dependent oxidoreductase [uncultured Pigmentiphaga sp.]|jgi:Dehydrogenases with different specificities (related to short-chain alcohol dehydrogenases)|uniref:SDR family NAD(P)-dependent oxidoreductase n=1 Tax=uncultured Pigmentiphaga sp. TaxID=340361 RepID=UPI00260C5E72|nr:SDR family NAD(P)-dependent oxidoreductase [uncultured Pigmentiphaga sp.]